METTTQKNHLLKEMYPYDIENKRNADLRKGLKEYAFFLQALSEASHHFQNGDLEKFDSLVCENACQVRAVKVAIIASQKNQKFDCLICRVAAAQEKLSILLKEPKIAFLMTSNVSLDEIIEFEKLDVVLTHEEFFLFQAFLLCEMKELAASKGFLPDLISKDKSSPKKLKKFSPDISASFTNCVVNKARRRIAETSINFVRKSASKLEDESLMKMTSKDFTLAHNTLPCLPMFWTYKTLLQTAKNESIPLVAHVQFITEHENGYKIVEEETLFFKIVETLSGFHYELTTQEMIDPNMPACVIQGVMKMESKLSDFDKIAWKNRMASHSIIDIILAGAADHKQYPTEDSGFLFSDSEYEKYKAIAKNSGFSIDNPNTFFINHVFSMQTGRIPNLAKVS